MIVKRIIIVILIQVFVNRTYDISGNPFYADSCREWIPTNVVC